MPWTRRLGTAGASRASICLPMRPVDVLPTILTVMEVEFDPAHMDGEAIELSVSQLR